MLRQESCTGPRYKYQTPAIVKEQQSIQYTSHLLFRLQPPLDRVDNLTLIWFEQWRSTGSMQPYLNSNLSLFCRVQHALSWH